jgi:ABC-2 type transport system permease protein
MSLRLRLLANSWLQLGLVAVLIVLVNLVGLRWFERLDLTADRVHTLSHAGRVLMERLEKPLVVKVYFTKDLEAPYNNHERILVDKLEEFQAWSHGRMELTVVDPTEESQQAEAQRLGIVPIPYSFRSESRQELRQVYMGAAFIYGDVQKTLPAITQVETIEYDLARTIKTLIDADDIRTLGFLTGHGEPDVLTGRGPLEALRKTLSQSYNLQSVELGGETGVPEAVDALFIIGPQSQLTAREQYQVDQFLMQGKPVAFFLSNFKPDFRSFRTAKVDHGLFPLIGHFGVELNQDLVADRVSNGKMRLPVRQGNYLKYLPVNYPLIPVTKRLARDSVVVKDLDTMTFPFVSSIDVPEDGLDVDYEVLARSGPDSGRIKAVKRLEPSAYDRRDPSEQVGEWPLLVTASGSFPSSFKGREIPDSPPGGELEPFIEQSAPTRVVVAGSADFIANNQAFMANLADWMAQDEDLISIRSKSVQVASLEPMDRGERLIVKLAVLLGPILLLLLYGALRSFRRRPSRKAA